MIIKPGKYKHYKNNFYEVIATVRHSETLEELILYKALYKLKNFPDDQLWVRPKKIFTENLTIDGKQVPCFKFISKN